MYRVRILVKFYCILQVQNENIVSWSSKVIPSSCVESYIKVIYALNNR